MLSKKETKDIQSLSQKKFRKELKLFLAEGPKIVSELIQLIPGKIENVYALPEWINSSGHHDKVKITEISQHELEKISALQTPNQVVAVLRQWSAERPPSESFTVYLDGIQDPGNFGTIIRIADWFGIKNIVCSNGCAELFNPKVVQSTMASIARVNVYYDEAGDWLPAQQGPVFAAMLDGKSLNEFPKTDKGILLIGNESRGISEELMQHATEKITIPRKGEAESLNAAVATGILLSHLLN